MGHGSERAVSMFVIQNVCHGLVAGFISTGIRRSYPKTWKCHELQVRDDRMSHAECSCNLPHGVILLRISDNLNCLLRMKEHYGRAETRGPTFPGKLLS